MTGKITSMWLAESRANLSLILNLHCSVNKCVCIRNFVSHIINEQSYESLSDIYTMIDIWKFFQITLA